MKELPFDKHVLSFDLETEIVLTINTTTGAIDLIPRRFIDTMPDNVRGILMQRGYFLSENERMNHLRRLAAISERQQQYVPYWFYVLTTLNCNLGCPICYEKRIKTSAELDTVTLTSVFSAIDAYQRTARIPNERMNVVLFGGEPFCVTGRGIIRCFLEYVAARGWKAVIVSNGTLIRHYVDVLSEFRDSISDFRISLDGPPAIHDMRRPYLGGRGSFSDVVHAIDLLLGKQLTVKMQTIFGRGNAHVFDELATFVEDRGWLADPNFYWRIEGSHDYANLDPEKDELSEARIVSDLIREWEAHRALRGKMKFESFKYLGHIVSSFGWIGRYKTYSGPKFGFCDPQKGLHFVFSTDGRVYHCPRTIDNPLFLIGDAETGLTPREEELKRRSILQKNSCVACPLNTLCGGGCIVQQTSYPNFDCQIHAQSVITDFVALMKDRIMALGNLDRVTTVNQPW